MRCRATWWFLWVCHKPTSACLTPAWYLTVVKSDSLVGLNLPPAWALHRCPCLLSVTLLHILSCHVLRCLEVYVVVSLVLCLLLDDFILADDSFNGFLLDSGLHTSDAASISEVDSSVLSSLCSLVGLVLPWNDTIVDWVWHLIGPLQLAGSLLLSWFDFVPEVVTLVPLVQVTACVRPSELLFVRVRLVVRLLRPFSGGLFLEVLDLGCSFDGAPDVATFLLFSASFDLGQVFCLARPMWRLDALISRLVDRAILAALGRLSKIWDMPLMHIEQCRAVLSMRSLDQLVLAWLQLKVLVQCLV